MPKSAASAHMTTATLLLVAAALSFAGFPATLNLPCPPRSTAQGTLCNRQRRYLHHPGPSGRSPGFPDPPTPGTSTRRKCRVPNTSTDTLLHDFRNLQGQLADPTTTLEAPLDTYPFTLGLETTHATLHTPTQKPDTFNHTQPGPPLNPAANPTLKRQPSPEAAFSLEPNSAFCYHRA